MLKGKNIINGHLQTTSKIICVGEGFDVLWSSFPERISILTDTHEPSLILLTYKIPKKNQTHSIFFFFFLILFLVGTKLIYTNWAMSCLTYTCFFFFFLSKRAIATCRPSKNIYVQKSISYPCESVIFLKLGNCKFLFFFSLIILTNLFA